MRPLCSAPWGRTPGAYDRTSVTDEVLNGRSDARFAWHPCHVETTFAEHCALLGHLAERTYRALFVMITHGRHDLMRRLIVMLMRMHSRRAHDHRHARK